MQLGIRSRNLQIVHKAYTFHKLLFTKSPSQSDRWRYDGTVGGNTTGSKRGDNPNLDFITREEVRAGIDATFNLQIVHKAYTFHKLLFTKSPSQSDRWRKSVAIWYRRHFIQ